MSVQVLGKTLRTRQLEIGDDHEETLNVMNNLGGTMYAQKRFEASADMSVVGNVALLLARHVLETSVLKKLRDYCKTDLLRRGYAHRTVSNIAMCKP